MIYVASDHAGFELKSKLIEWLKDQGYKVEDLGPYELNPEDDYPDFVYPCAQKVAADPGSVGIVIGGTGQGEAMVANKVMGVRAAVYYGPSATSSGPSGSGSDVIRLSKEHNNANVLSLSARFLTEDEAIQAVKTWLETKFSGEERHVRRINKISQLDARS